MFTRILAALTGGAIAATAAEPLQEGAKLPDVGQRNHEGVPLRLSEGGKGYLLVYFYPKADTPGCTKQACSLRDSFADLTARQVRVIGVSSDTPAAQKAFREKFRLPFDLLADEDGSVAAAFGVPRIMGFAKRQAFLFRDGVLVWRDLSASTTEQAADVLAFLKAAGVPAKPGD
jgi:peroxiredoxin Q/BCP